MASSIRAISTSLPRISMARIPLVAFTNTHVAPTITSQTHAHAHANSAHPSAYSSMPPRSNKYTNAADKLEQSAKNMSKSAKDYIREVKRYDSEEDEVLMELGLAMSSSSIKRSNSNAGNKHTANQSGGRKAHVRQSGGTFEESLSSDIQADVRHPASKGFHHADQHHQQELVSSLCEELKGQPSASSSSRLSQHASDAIRMVESHNILKHDKAPVHDVREEDPSEKVARYQKRH
ncbi:hypothetical protein BG015_002258 [Linnemannia schmuckeri]|uniref:Uncharacterized protein n=1 Tax=Linnemannia schmuckeri TaxID=64567 RepID=A0A9P5VDQ6_9FUNG|nr:hypothetical protein BG015_002258 [Linnemannia schmuckeri]